jgi:hypothetical protein
MAMATSSRGRTEVDGDAEDGQDRDGEQDKGDDGGQGDRFPYGSGCSRFRCLAGAVLAAGDPRRGDRLIFAVCGDEQPGGEVEGRAGTGDSLSTPIATRTATRRPDGPAKR